MTETRKLYQDAQKCVKGCLIIIERLQKLSQAPQHFDGARTRLEEAADLLMQLNENNAPKLKTSPFKKPR